MAKKYHVTLTDEEREELAALVQRGKTQGYRIRHAQILLKLDEVEENKGWTIAKIGEAYKANPSTVIGVAKRFVEEGLQMALGRKEQVNRCRKVDGKVEAHMVAIACSTPPEGRDHWTLQMIADEMVRLEIVESISDTAVHNTLKKTKSNHGKRKNGAFPSQALNS